MNAAAQKAERIRIELPVRKEPARKPAAGFKPSTLPATELFELNAAAEHARQVINSEPGTRNAERAQRGRPAHIVTVGSIKIPIYREKDGRYLIAWYEGNTRKRTRRAKLSEAKQLAELKGTAMANGQTFMASMTQAHRATLERVIEILAPTGKSPELAAAEFAADESVLRETGLTRADMHALLREHAARAKIVPIDCPGLVQKFMAAKRAGTFGTRTAGGKWLRILEGQLETFAEHFKCQFHQLRAKDLIDWINGIPGSGYTRRGYRTAVSGLVSFARAKENNHIPKDWDELSQVPIPKKGRIKKTVYTPEQLAKLLAAASDGEAKMVPFLVIGAFAGVRHEEMNPEDKNKTPLDWSDIGDKVIHIGANTAKNDGDERWIPMPKNLIAWLAPFRKLSGPICTVANTSNALWKLKKKAGIPGGKNETRNALRKSWETYNQALKDDIKLVAGEAGHSQDVARRHYVASREGATAKRWFNIQPTEGEILQLNFALK